MAINETPPSGLKSVKSELYIAPDNSTWHFQGVPYNWQRLASYSDLNLYLAKSGGNMTGDIQFNDVNSSKGLIWNKNTDYGKIYFESTDDASGDSNLIFENGDNSLLTGLTEGFIFRKKGTESSSDIYTDVVNINLKDFKYLTNDVIHQGSIGIGLSYNSTTKILSATGGSGTDPNAIHKTGDETAVGEKTFNSPFYLSNTTLSASTKLSYPTNKELVLQADNAGLNVLVLQNTNTAGNSFSAVALRGADGVERGAFGYGNTDFPAFNRSTFIEASYFPGGDGTLPPSPFKIVQTGVMVGIFKQRIRTEWLADGKIRDYFVDSGFGTIVGREFDAINGLSKLTSVVDGGNVLEIKNNSSTGYSAISFKDTTGAERFAVGYAAPGTSVLAGNIIAGENYIYGITNNAMSIVTNSIRNIRFNSNDSLDVYSKMRALQVPTASTDVVRKLELDTKQNTISLTTTGSSGAATFDGTTLNIPNYAGGGGSFVDLTTNQTAAGNKTWSGDATFTGTGVKIDQNAYFKHRNLVNQIAGYGILSTGTDNGWKFTSATGISRSFQLFPPDAGTAYAQFRNEDNSITPRLVAYTVQNIDYEVTDSSKGLILKDTALATRHRITLTNGVLTVSAAL